MLLVVEIMSDISWGWAIGLGIFTSFFAAAGLLVWIQTILALKEENECNPCLIGFALFRFAFACPFIAIPFIVGYGTPTMIIGYTLPFFYFSCYICSQYSICQCKNPIQSKSKQSSNYVHEPLLNDNNKSDDIKLEIKDKKTDELYIWLNEINLSEYYIKFINEGYKTIDDICTINEKDLNELGIIKQFHRKQIIIKINQTKAAGNTNQAGGESDYIATADVPKDEPPKDEAPEPLPAYTAI